MVFYHYKNNSKNRVITFSQSIHSSQIRLSPEELFSISEQVNREYKPKFSSRILPFGSGIKLSTKDLLAISEEIKREFVARPPLNSTQSVCMLIAVDPDHLHAYWHLDKKHQKTVNNSSIGEELILRVFAETDKKPRDEQFFDVKVDSAKSQQSIALPQSSTETHFSALIGRRYNKDKFVAFAGSNMTFVPRGGKVTGESHKHPAIYSKVSHFLGQNLSGKGLKSQI